VDENVIGKEHAFEEIAHTVFGFVVNEEQKNEVDKDDAEEEVVCHSKDKRYPSSYFVKVHPKWGFHHEQHAVSGLLNSVNRVHKKEYVATGPQEVPLNIKP